MKKLILSLMLLLSSVAHSQLWSGYLSSSRAIDWTHAGATIPTSWKQCGSTIAAYSGTAAVISAAIAACPGSHYVQLGAGTFTLSTMVDWASKSGVLLRGAGSNSTFIVTTASVAGCSRGFDVPAFCMMSTVHGTGSDDSYDTEVPWSSGYAVGSTSITVGTFARGSISNLRVGSIIFLDQFDDSVPTVSDVTVCQIANFCSTSASSSNCRSQNHRLTRPASQCEPQLVTSVTGSGPWTIGISPGVRMPNINSSKSPTLWANSGLPISNVGIEDLSIDIRSSSVYVPIMMLDCVNCWVKGVAFLGPSSADGFHMVWSYQSRNVTVRDSYFFGAVGGSDSYAISNYASADNLFENNIQQHMQPGDVMEGCIGCVQGYSFAIDDFYNAGGGAPEWQQASSYHHGVGDAFVLIEGNVGIGLTGDDVHGTSNMFTALRNYWNGRDPQGGSVGGKTQQTNAVLVYSYNRFWNLLGNVLGTLGYHDTYQGFATIANSHSGDCTAGCYTDIYLIGYSGNGGTYQGAVKNDLLTVSSMFRWGNWDTVTNAVRWCGTSSNTGWVSTCGSTSEVPTGLSLYPNSVPAAETVPSSFYLNSQPVWWPASIPWPSIGPEVTGGNILNTGGHAYLNPAASCYLNVMHGPTNGANTPAAFDSKICYSPTTTPGLAPLFAWVNDRGRWSRVTK